MRIKPRCAICGRELGVTFIYKRRTDEIKVIATSTECQKCYLVDEHRNVENLLSRKEFTKIAGRKLHLEIFCLYCGGSLFRNLPMWEGKGIPVMI